MATFEARCTKYGAMSTTTSYKLSGYDKFVTLSLEDQKTGEGISSHGNRLQMSDGKNSSWIYLYGFDGLQSLQNDAKIKSIKVNIRGGATSGTASSASSCICKVMFIKDFATSGTTSSYTALSTEQTVFSGSNSYVNNTLNTVTYNSSSTLVNWANNNIATMKSDNFGIRIYSVYSQINGLWIEVELSDGSLIFNGSSNITSAYLGSTKLNGIYLGSNKLL